MGRQHLHVNISPQNRPPWINIFLTNAVKLAHHMDPRLAASRRRGLCVTTPCQVPLFLATYGLRFAWLLLICVCMATQTQALDWSGLSI